MHTYSLYTLTSSKPVHCTKNMVVKKVSSSERPCYIRYDVEKNITFIALQKSLNLVNSESLREYVNSFHINPKLN